MNNKEAVLEEKGPYKLVVGESEVDSKPCYQIINKEYGVIEVETKILPQALKFLEDLSVGLAAMSELIKEDISSKLKEGEGNVVDITTVR